MSKLSSYSGLYIISALTDGLGNSKGVRLPVGKMSSPAVPKISLEGIGVTWSNWKRPDEWGQL